VDLILLTGFDLDWGDLEDVLVRQPGKLNMNQIRSEFEPLLELKGEPQALAKLESIAAKVERRLGKKL